MGGIGVESLTHIEIVTVKHFCVTGEYLAVLGAGFLYDNVCSILKRYGNRSAGFVYGKDISEDTRVDDIKSNVLSACPVYSLKSIVDTVLILYLNFGNGFCRDLCDKSDRFYSSCSICRADLKLLMKLIGVGMEYSRYLKRINSLAVIGNEIKSFHTNLVVIHTVLR